MEHFRAYALLLIPLVVLLAGATPITLDSRIADYHVQATFIDGLPHEDEPTRIAVTVLDPRTQAIPDDPAIVMITGNAVSYQITLDRVPTTIIALPGLAQGSYDLRVQVPNVGIAFPHDATLCPFDSRRTFHLIVTMQASLTQTSGVTWAGSGPLFRGTHP